ncbi:DUF2971 domain-containing protein [Sphingomonas turrisvirgatae]|uniref:DUF2971 domain-containing protein n=1 Tax=Sphingomonas turrisvirgatae TaxID=1888892 RepID=A0A1E3LUC2_9SPHN|nr:DUF2971 domain-containing protein [Sphingomonas turrisvirgatae]ODP37352.1 hypothetical protein BFL28_18270 [Sphingomonas turrisvirgatae]
MLTEDQIEAVLNDTFFRWGKDREAEVTPSVKFAHYTSAQVAMDIIKAPDEDRCLWLRNAMLMNDFSEIEYGQQLLRLSLTNEQLRNRLIEACNDIHEGILGAFRMIDQEVYAIKRSTYLLSLALHKGAELHQGKLSMWRAYGGDTNVCILLNPEAFMTPQSAYDAVIAPVDYGGPGKFVEGVAAIVETMIANRDALRQIDPETVKTNLKYALDVMILSTKHPGFEEENEWRVINRAQLTPAPNSPPSKIVSVNGIVQKVFYLPMKNIPEHDVANADINTLLFKILIGETPNPDLVWEGFVTLLAENGIQNPVDKVIACNIPLRR